MKILILYATYSGGTQLAGQIIKEALEKKGHTGTLRNVFEFDPKEIKNYEFLILGSNTWFELKEEGQMNSGYHELKDRMGKVTLGGKKCAIYTLGDSNLYNVSFCKSADHLEEFVKEYKGVSITPPLKIDRFYFDEEEQTKRILQWAESVATVVGVT